MITTGKKKRYSREKKRSSRLSVGCAVLAITIGKKRYSRLSVGCAVLAIMTGKKKIQSKKRYITTGKRRYSRLSDGCAVLAITTGKKKRYSRLGKFSLRPEKKKIHYDRKKKKIQSSLAGNSHFFCSSGKF